MSPGAIGGGEAEWRQRVRQGWSAVAFLANTSLVKASVTSSLLRPLGHTEWMPRHQYYRVSLVKLST